MCHCILLLSVLILYDLIGKFDLLMIQFLPEVDINLNIENHAPFKTNIYTSLTLHVFTCRTDGKTSVGADLVLMVSPVKPNFTTVVNILNANLYFFNSVHILCIMTLYYIDGYICVCVHVCEFN